MPEQDVDNPVHLHYNMHIVGLCTVVHSHSALLKGFTLSGRLGTHSTKYSKSCALGALGWLGKTILMSLKASMMETLSLNVIWAILTVTVTVIITQRCSIYAANVLMWVLSATQATWLITIIFVVLQRSSSITHIQKQSMRTAFQFWLSMYEFSSCCLIWKP